MSRILVGLAAISLGCAAQKPQQKTQYASDGQAKPKPVLRCHMEQETGSNFAVRVCNTDNGTPAGASDSAIEDSMDAAQRRASQHVIPPNSGGR